MGRVLLIEPQKILQRAVSLALFPEHEVQVEENWGSLKSGSLGEYDLLIIDGGALREGRQLTPEVVRAIQACEIPTLWLEEDESSQQPPKREKIILVKKPIERKAFQSAVSHLFSPQAASRKRGGSPAAPGSKSQTSSPGTKKAAPKVPQQSTFDFIDLVDVIEEETPPERQEKSPRGKAK